MKITIIGCGGAGSNVASYIKEGYDVNYKSEIRTLHIDTSINNNFDDDNFYHIKSSDLSEEKLNGSGGVIKENIEHIKTGINDFININSLHKTKDLVVVIFSLSGGSGSGTGLEICNNLISKGVTVLPVVIADTTTLQYTKTSTKAFGILNTYAVKNNVALPTMLFNNSDYVNNDKGTRIEHCNNDIKLSFETLSIFTSGQNRDLDDKDMENFLKPSTYVDLEIEHGLYSLLVGCCDYSKDRLDECNIILARTLKSDTYPKATALSNHKMLQYKEGTSSYEDIETHIDMYISDTLSDKYKKLKDATSGFNVTDKKSIPVIQEEDLY